MAFYLKSEAQNLRAAAVEVVFNCSDERFAAAVLERLAIEQVPEIRQRLFEALANIDASRYQEFAAQFSESELPEDRGGASILLFESGATEKAIEQISQLASAEEARNRRCAARTLTRLIDPGLEPILKDLLADNSESVRLAALQAAEHWQAPALIPDMVALLGKGRTSFAARRIA